MGPLLVLVSHCFRENVVVRLCSLDNLLQKNVIVFFFENQISKWRSFEEKKELFLTYFSQFFSYQGKITKKKKFKDISHSHTHMCFAHPIEFFILPYQFWKKYEFIRHSFSLVWFLVLILIHAILEQSINNKMVSNYTNAKFIVISKPRT